MTYADDLVILCRRGKAQEALLALREIMGRLKLTVNEGEDTNLHGTGRRVRLSGLHLRADVFSEDRQGLPGLPAGKEEHPAHG